MSLMMLSMVFAMITIAMSSAQRISSVQNADRILVLDDGRIDAIGTHDELLKSCEIYREVYQSQQKGGNDYE